MPCMESLADPKFMMPGAERERLTAVVPAYNEAAGLGEFHRRLCSVFDRLPVSARVLYVDDGSTDETWATIESLARTDPRVQGLRLARNFGKELALTAGLDAVETGAAVVLDADLQDPPELIETFVGHWLEGHDVVYGVRTSRDGDSFFKRVTAHLFYRVMGRMADVSVPRDTGDFRLLSDKSLADLRRLRERHRFMKGLFAWIGGKQLAVCYQRERRHHGRSTFNAWRLWNFALEGLTSFSTAPLRVATYLGMLVAGLAFSFGLWIIAKTLLYSDPVAGYPSLMAVVLFLGGVQLMALGIIGEYLGRLFDEAKQRPLYLVAEVLSEQGLVNGQVAAQAAMIASSSD